MMELSNSVLLDMARAFTRGLDSGGLGGVLEVYATIRPTVKGGDPMGSPSAVFTFPHPSEASVSGGVLQLNSPANTLALSSSVVKWARYKNSVMDFIADCDVSEPLLNGDGSTNSNPVINGVPHGAGEVQFTSVHFYEGGEISLLAGTVQET